MTSAVRVFGKSMHWLALGWAAGVVWLCVAQMQRGWLLDPGAPTNYHLDTLIEGAAPALLIEVMAFFTIAWSGTAPTRALEVREWVVGFIWAAFPNLMVLYAVYLMVIGEI